MSRLIFDKKENHGLDYVYDSNNEWTTGRLKDEFFIDLTKARGEIKTICCDHGVTGNVIHYKKYYRQAISKLYIIPLTANNPKSEEEALAFVINFNDLSARVQKEFLEYCKQVPRGNVTLLLKEVVIRLFENLDYNYAHMSIMKKLRVKVID